MPVWIVWAVMRAARVRAGREVPWVAGIRSVECLAMLRRTISAAGIRRRGLELKEGWGQ